MMLIGKQMSKRFRSAKRIVLLKDLVALYRISKLMLQKIYIFSICFATKMNK